MSIDRRRVGRETRIVFVCDECGEELDTEWADFLEAVDEAKRSGWWFTLDEATDEWTHWCPTCRP